MVENLTASQSQVNERIAQLAKFHEKTNEEFVHKVKQINDSFNYEIKVSRKKLSDFDFMVGKTQNEINHVRQIQVEECHKLALAEQTICNIELDISLIQKNKTNEDEYKKFVLHNNSKIKSLEIEVGRLDDFVKALDLFVDKYLQVKMQF